MGRGRVVFMTKVDQLIVMLYEYSSEQAQDDRMILIPFEMRWTCPLCGEITIHHIGNIPPKYCCDVPQGDTKHKKG